MHLDFTANFKFLCGTYMSKLYCVVLGSLVQMRPIVEKACVPRCGGALALAPA